MDQIYDVILIGGGAAAASAVLTLKNRGKTAAVVSNRAETSSLYKAEMITNYPGLPPMSGAEMTALISANLAVVNLLPLPGLDGGKLLFILIELMRGGKKVSAKVEGILSMIFFGLLILLAIIVAGSDIFRLAGR